MTTTRYASGPELAPEVAAQQTVDEPDDLVPTVREDGVRSYPDVAFARLGGYRPLVLDLHVPAGEEPFPVVVYLHGGAWLWGGHGGTLYDIGGALLARGIAVASAQYRLSGEARFPAPSHDVASAIRWLKNADALGIDPERVGVMGESAGGHLALLAGSNDPDPWLTGEGGVIGPDARVRAAVGWYPVTDFTLFAAEEVPSDAPPLASWPESLLLGVPPIDDLDLARRASPVHRANPGAAPTLLLHGDADDDVPDTHSRALVDALVAAGVEARLVSVPGAGHVFTGVDPAPLVGQTADFFARHLL